MIFGASGQWNRPLRHLISYLLEGIWMSNEQPTSPVDSGLTEAMVKLWSLRSMREKFDLSTLLYLLYVLGILGLGVYLLTL